jgi:hypothetical protein
MDAVMFSDAIHRQPQAPPPAPAKKRSRISPNASLIAGVGTLLLALGIGVLIGQTNESSAVSAANAAPQIIRVGGGPEETATAATSADKNTAAKGGKPKQAEAPEKAVDSSGTSEAAAEVLKPAGDVKLPPPTVQPGGKCESGAAGCDGGEFTGEFFGE